MSGKKLSPTQAELLEAMTVKGVIVYYMPYMGRFRPNAYFFRSDTSKHCTAPAKALEKRGLVERFNVQKYNGHYSLRAKAEPQGGADAIRAAINKATST